MPEKDYKIEAVRVHYYCDNCGQKLEYVGNIYPTNPTTYQHRCHDCGKIYKLEKVYPIVEFREVDAVPHRINAPWEKEKNEK